TTPAASRPNPAGNSTGRIALSAPERIFQSTGLTPTALTATSSSPGPALGLGTSISASVSGPPYAVNTYALAIWPLPARRRADTSGARGSTAGATRTGPRREQASVDHRCGGGSPLARGNEKRGPHGPSGFEGRQIVVVGFRARSAEGPAGDRAAGA